MAASSPQAGRLAQLAAMVDNGPRMAAQRKAISAIRNSPHVTVQRKQVDSITGEAAQRADADVTGAGAMIRQRKSTCAGLANVNYNSLNSAGQTAYGLLDNQRDEFAKIDKKDGGVNAQVDGEGRVISAERELSNKAAERDSKLQAVIGWLGRLEEGETTGYDGGHLIASSLGGPGTWGNMVPQDYIENRWGSWREYERAAAKANLNTGSSSLFLKIQLGYSGDSVLPSKWDSQLADKNNNTLAQYP